MEIITGVERRRRWSLEEKLRIAAETEQPGAGIAEIAGAMRSAAACCGTGGAR
jgi:transposase-like protein